MSRNRQRAKQRQAERRAKRQGAAGSPRDEVGTADPPVADPPAAEPPAADDAPPVPDPRAAPPAPGIDPELAVGAPPQDEGRSDRVIADEPYLDEDEHLTDEEELEELRSEEDEGYAPRGRRGIDGAEKKDRPRVIQFLIHVWAELQRVQWPKRQALTTLTGVVLGFVLLAGGYLGLLDAIINRFIQAIL